MNVGIKHDTMPCFDHRSDLEIEANISFDSLQNEGASLPLGQILLDSLSLQGIENSYVFCSLFF